MFDANNYGITWDTNLSHWWTTDDTDNVNPALFDRFEGGGVDNSYNNYDTLGDPDRCRSIVYLDSFLWAVGNDEKCYKIDPADGTTDSTFNILGNTDVGIGTDGTNLFICETDSTRILEYTTAGSLQNNDQMPTGRVLSDMTFDGTDWWATVGTVVIRMAADGVFTELEEIAGPGFTIQGCHWKDGFLYVMGPDGLWRRPV
jgi:hypothetical protein